MNNFIKFVKIIEIWVLNHNGVANGKDAVIRVEFLADRLLFQLLRDEIVF